MYVVGNCSGDGDDEKQRSGRSKCPVPDLTDTYSDIMNYKKCILNSVPPVLCV